MFSASVRAQRVDVFGLAAVIGLASMIVLLSQVRDLIHALYLNSDHASALVLPALAGHASVGATVNLGDHLWYEPWLFMRATADLPHYRQLWEAAPFLFALLGIASVIACAWWVFGGRGAVLSGAVLISASDAMRGVIFVPESHVATILHMGIFCGALLFVYERAKRGRLSRVTLLAFGVPFVFFTALGLTDQLLLVAGLAPFVTAPLICWWRLRTREWRTVAVFAVVTGGLALLLGMSFTHVMEDRHVVHAPFPITFVSSAAIFRGMENVIAEFASLGGGSFFGRSASGGNLLILAVGALVLGALVGSLRVIWRWGVSAVARDAADIASGRRELFIAYWGFALLFVLGSVLLTSVSETGGNGRYLLGAWVAVAALLGAVSVTAKTRAAVAAGVCLFSILSLHAHLSEGVVAYGIGPDQRTAGAIEHFALANGATVGYAGYWTAAPVTWETGFRVKVYPVGRCLSPSGLGPPSSGWCPFYNNMISGWYTPRPYTRTFLITDSLSDDPLGVRTPPVAFGHPTAQAAFGAFAVYIYDHDLAAALTS